MGAGSDARLTPAERRLDRPVAVEPAETDAGDQDADLLRSGGSERLGPPGRAPGPPRARPGGPSLSDPPDRRRSASWSPASVSAGSTATGRSSRRSAGVRRASDPAPIPQAGRAA